MNICRRSSWCPRIAPRYWPLTWAILAAVSLGPTLIADAQAQRELPPGSPALMQPEQLVSTLKSTAKPTVFYVGPKFLYAQAHIPGAEFIGPASDNDSLDRLRKRAVGLTKNSSVVLYCGCCPWDHCPNIRPAFKELQKLGFTNVKALYLPDSFGTDWADKGYPVE